jgi:hypothetical protein
VRFREICASRARLGWFGIRFREVILGPIVIVALAGSPASPTAIDKTGEVFVGAVSQADGGIAGEVVAATGQDAIFVGVANAPPFERLPKTGWSVMNLGLHAIATLGRGERATAAVGRGVFALERGKATKLGDAPANVIALGASAKAIAIETDRGIARFDNGTWKPLAKAPQHVDALLDARRALTARGVIDLDTGAVVAWPLGFHVQAAVAVDEVVYAASARELAIVKAGAVAKEALPPLATPIVGIVADKAGRVALVTRGGQLAQKLAATWTVNELRALPAIAHAGSPPAESK